MLSRGDLQLASARPQVADSTSASRCAITLTRRATEGREASDSYSTLCLKINAGGRTPSLARRAGVPMLNLRNLEDKMPLAAILNRAGRKGFRGAGSEVFSGVGRGFRQSPR